MILEHRRNKLKLGVLFITLVITGHCLAQNTAVELTEMNLLYKGLNNKFKVAVEGVSSKDVVLKTSRGLEIEYVEKESFIRVKSKSERVEYITVGKLTKLDTQWLDTYSYRVRNLPQPTAQLGELVNDGLPKKKEDVLKQMNVIASMGRSFAYDFPYKIIGFKLIVAYENKPPIMMSSSSGKLTGQMRKALATTTSRDKVLIEGIRAVNEKFGFKVYLSPVIITIWDSKPNSLKQDRELLYIKIEPDNMETNAIYKKDVRDETTDTINYGVVDWVFKDDNGFKRERRVYKNGVVTEKMYFDDNGKLIYRLGSAPKSKWKYESFYKNGETKVECLVDDSIDYVGNTEILECDNYILGHYFGENSRKKCDSIVHRSMETDVHHIKYMYELNPIGNFKSFYPNGTVKSEGNLILGYNTADTLSREKRPLSEEYSNHFMVQKDIAVMDGIWKYYYKDGTIRYTCLYEKGVLIKN